MIEKKSWDEFRTTGLAVFINSFLHIFGWCIVFDVEDGKAVNCYPAKCPWKGFKEDTVEKAYKKIDNYLREEYREEYR